MKLMRSITATVKTKYKIYNFADKSSPNQIWNVNLDLLKSYFYTYKKYTYMGVRDGSKIGQIGLKWDKSGTF